MDKIVIILLCLILAFTLGGCLVSGTFPHLFPEPAPGTPAVTAVPASTPAVPPSPSPTAALTEPPAATPAPPPAETPTAAPTEVPSETPEPAPTQNPGPGGDIQLPVGP